jgi:hypothetical protein
MKKYVITCMLAIAAVLSTSAQDTAKHEALIKGFLTSLQGGKWNHLDIDNRYFITIDYSAVKPEVVKEIDKFHEQQIEEIENKLAINKVAVSALRYIHYRNANFELLKKVGLEPLVDVEGNLVLPTSDGDVYIATNDKDFNVPFLLKQNKIASFSVMRPKSTFIIYL